VFRYEPIPAALGNDQARHVLGGQAQLWGEYIATPEHRMYMTYPRAAALAEVLWSPKADRDYDGFLKRLTVHVERLKAASGPLPPLVTPAPAGMGRAFTLWGAKIQAGGPAFASKAGHETSIQTNGQHGRSSAGTSPCGGSRWSLATGSGTVSSAMPDHDARMQ